ncbi:CBS domain protein, partial [Teladorsagia circumcincta]
LVCKALIFRERGQADALVDDKHDLGKLTIQQYRELVQKEGKLKELVYINANNSLLEAARLLAQHRIHRLPVLDPESGSPLFILTHKRLLKFLWCFGQQFSQPDYHIRTAKDLNVGSWVGIRVVFPDTPLTICLDILLNKGVSGVPVVERDTFKVVDMYSRFDAVGIALEESADSLDVSVEQALKFKNLGRGIISLSDVINHMVVKPGANLKPIRVPRRHYTSHPYDCSDVDLRSRLQDSATLLEDTATGKLRKDISNLSLR